MTICGLAICTFLFFLLITSDKDDLSIPNSNVAEGHELYCIVKCILLDDSIEGPQNVYLAQTNALIILETAGLKSGSAYLGRHNGPIRTGIIQQQQL